MTEIGLESPRSFIAHSMEDANAAQAKLGFPTIIRPSFTLGGTGGGIAFNREEFAEMMGRAGLEEVRAVPQTFGVCHLFTGVVR